MLMFIIIYVDAMNPVCFNPSHSETEKKRQ